MAKTIGHCTECGQTFKKARVSGNRKGYSVINKGKKAAKIRCTSCGNTGTVHP